MGIQSQPRIKGKKRRPTSTSAEARLWAAIDREARFFNCSRSYVLALAAAETLGVELDYSYKETKRRKRRAA